MAGLGDLGLEFDEVGEVFLVFGGGDMEAAFGGGVEAVAGGGGEIGDEVFGVGREVEDEGVGGGEVEGFVEVEGFLKGFWRDFEVLEGFWRIGGVVGGGDEEFWRDFGGFGRKEGLF